MLTTENPVNIEGWVMFHEGFDKRTGINSIVVPVRLLYLPWLPAFYAGVFIFITGIFFWLVFFLMKNIKGNISGPFGKVSLSENFED